MWCGDEVRSWVIWNLAGRWRDSCLMLKGREGGNERTTYFQIASRRPWDYRPQSTDNNLRHRRQQGQCREERENCVGPFFICYGLSLRLRLRWKRCFVWVGFGCVKEIDCVDFVGRVYLFVQRE